MQEVFLAKKGPGNFTPNVLGLRNLGGPARPVQARSFGQRLACTGERFEWIKPIMLSGGIGQMDHKHVEKQEPQKAPTENTSAAQSMTKLAICRTLKST